MKRTPYLGVVALAVLLGFVLLSIGTGAGAYANPAATIVVTTLNDTVDTDGFCSLREAITAANTDSPSGPIAGECPAGSGADTIELGLGIYSMVLAYGDDLVISSTMTITGTDNMVWLRHASFQTGSRFFHVLPNGNLTLGNMIIEGARAFGGFEFACVPNPPPPGESGGAILSEGALTIEYVEFVDNQAGDGNTCLFDDFLPSPGGSGGAIAVTAGTFSISHARFIEHVSGDGAMTNNEEFGSNAGVGGAIYQAANTTGTIAYTTFSENAGGSASPAIDGGRSGDGGAIYTAGSLSITHSTMQDNRSGGGANGGAIATAAGSDLIIDASTLSGNATTIGLNFVGDGGALYIRPSSHVTITNSTIAYNETTLKSSGYGGGIYNSDVDTTVILSNTIVANNHTSFSEQGPDCYPAVTSGGYLLVSDTTGCTIQGSTTGNLLNVNPLLLALANNGGETRTHALPANSPALDAGNCPTATSDQRNLPRPVDIPAVPNAADGCDIGAFEANAELATPTVTPTPSPTSTFPPTSTPTPSVTGTPPTATATVTATPTIGGPTETPTPPVETVTPTVTGTPPITTPTNTAVPTGEPSATPPVETATVTPEVPTPSATVTPTATPTQGQSRLYLPLLWRGVTAGT